MIRTHSRSRYKNPAVGSGAPFTPLSLFTVGEQGLWLDPSDMTTLFQDNLGTVPVTAAGQVVGMIQDKSGNGNHATQATAANKPILRNAGSLWWLEFDGADDFLSTASIDLTNTNKITMFSGVRKNSDAASALIAEHGTASGVNPSASFFGPSSGGVNKFDFRIKGSTAAFAVTTNAAFNAPVTVAITGQGDLTAPLTILRLNGAQAGSVTSATGGGNFGNFPVFIGRTAAAASPFGGNIYGLIIRGVASAALAVSSTEGYMATKSGLTV